MFDWLVLPIFEAEQIKNAASGRLSLDDVTREFIHQHLAYRFVVTNDSAEARTLEATIRRDGLSGSQPLLNPKRSGSAAFAKRNWSCHP